MKSSCGMILVATLAAVSVSWATDGVVMATTTRTATFSINTVDTFPLAISSRTALDALADWPVTWRTNETVTTITQGGVVHSLVSEAGIPGNASFASFVNAGGMWTLSNSVLGSVQIGVSWAVFNDVDATLATRDALKPYALDTQGNGPNRTVRGRKKMLPVAYTGDNWLRNPSAASTLTFTSPSAVDMVCTNLTGTGAFSYVPTEPGVWRVTLASSIGTQVADINVFGGMVFSFR